ncbi:hypothetical protein T07_6846 [Trichinella nelsoni]|uniref:Uncharacterized protein n=1 Tax=Trichinella nelsoni TaxID=6336 RepID=A0A0V0RYL5_9BILA|nr:hypothetical protein T07_6846 [Trichinella nelsoni]
MSDSLELFLSDSSSHGIDSLWRTVEKQMSISVSVSNPEMNPFDDREAVWLPCKGKSSALARNSSMRSPGKVYSNTMLCSTLSKDSTRIDYESLLKQFSLCFKAACMRELETLCLNNPEMNPFDDREAVWLPCKGKSSALARNSSMRSHGKVYSNASYACELESFYDQFRIDMTPRLADPANGIENAVVKHQGTSVARRMGLCMQKF